MFYYLQTITLDTIDFSTQKYKILYYATSVSDSVSPSYIFYPCHTTFVPVLYLDKIQHQTWICIWIKFEFISFLHTVLVKNSGIYC